MNILVCVKNVPETAEADLEIADDEGSLDTDELAFSINEWDSYSVEAAIALKESAGATVTVLTIGDEEAEDALRRGLAMGADRAIHVCDELFDGARSAVLARALARAAKQTGEEYDLVLTGAQSSDLGLGQTGPLLAHELGMPYATLAVGLEIDGKKALVTRELEGRAAERVELDLPALVTVQSGLNQPRYVSILGIRKVRSKPIDELDAEELGFEEEELDPSASPVLRRVLSLPTTESDVEMIEGSLPELCSRAASIVRERGGL